MTSSRTGRSRRIRSRRAWPGAAALVVALGAGWPSAYAAPGEPNTVTSATARQVAVSVAADGSGVGAQAGDLSADGRTAVFLSAAAHVTADTPLVTQASLYVRDIGARTTRLVRSFPIDDPENVGDPSLSADARSVVHTEYVRQPDGSPRTRLLRIDTTTGAMRQLLPAADGLGVHGLVTEARLSFDGSRVAFTSNDPGLVPGDTNRATDVFEVAVGSRMVSLVSAAKDGTAGAGASYGAAVSGDGRYVAFVSAASNLLRGVRTRGTADVFRRDLVTGITQQVNDEQPAYPQDTVLECDISADGQRVTYTGRPPLNEYRRLSVLSVRDVAEPAPRVLATSVDSVVLSPDGRTVTYDVPRHLRTSFAAYQLAIDTGLTKAAVLPYRAPNQNDRYVVLATSSDARFVLFESGATNLTPHPVTGTPNMFLSDLSQP